MLIVNPSSGDGNAEHYTSRVKQQLLKKFDDADVFFTEKSGDAAHFSKMASQKKYDAVFCLGGDGTVSECINGIAEEKYRPNFGFVPLGTVNDLGRVLGMSMNPEEAIEEIPQMTKRMIDIGKINDYYFADVVAIGTIPKAVHEVSVDQKTRLGTMAYILEGARALKDNEIFHFRLSLDGQSVELNSFLVLVALTNSIGGIQTMIPQASIDDGYLHGVALVGEKIVDKLNVIPKIFSGNATEDKNVFYRSFKEGTIRIAEDKKVSVNVDGDEGDSLPVKLKILPHHIQCFVPSESDR